MLDENGKLINGEFRIETTNKCNAHCIYCPREKLTRPLTTMPFEHFKYLVEQAEELGAHTISPFGFGEPVLDKGLVQKIALCRDMGFDTFITSNASLLDADLASRLIEAGLTHIRFSVHSVDINTYEKLQYPLKFIQMCRNIFNFIKVNDIKYLHACEVSITCIPEVDESIDRIREFWENKVDNLEIWEPHNWLTGRKYRTIPKQKSGRKKRVSCGRPFRGPVQIQVDGTMIPCCFLTNSEFVLGNTYKKSVVDILNDWPMRWLQSMHENNRECYPCMMCDQYYKSDTTPLLYSSRDVDRESGRTSSIKFNLKGD